MWLARTRDSGHPIASRGSGRVSYVSETDTKLDDDSEEAASLFDKNGQDRQKLQEWLLCLTAMCRLFRSYGWRYCRGSIPSKSRTSAVMKIYVHRHTDATQ